MYWFWAILAAVVGILVVVAIIRHRKRVEQKRHDAEKMAEQMRRDAERRAKQRAKEEKKFSQIVGFYLKLNELPFELDKRQIIYVENEYDEAVNRFILRNYDAICKTFRFRGYEFCYLPKLADKVNTELRQYYKPGDESGKEISAKSSFLLDFMAHPENREKIKPSLVYVVEDIPLERGEALALRGLKFGDISLFDKDLDDILRIIINETKPVRESYSISFDIGDFNDRESYSISFDRGDFYERREKYNVVEPPKSADEEFDDESRQLMWEIREKIQRLQVKGISKYFLNQILFEQPKPSRLVITHDFRIFLPDYNNMEIVMTPLVKAVFILFLNHPEGIVFKSLPDYRSELLHIYMSIRGLKEATIDISRSVAAATNPFDNSINEKCARIREAFVEHFDEELAKHYFVTGKRGEPKAITLSRDLVVWE